MSNIKIIHPMLAKAVPDKILDKCFNNKNWICEQKMDGSRYILQFDKNGIPHLTSRQVSVKNGLPVEKTSNVIGHVARVYKSLAGTILDGEILGGGTFSETVKLMGSSPDKAQKMLAEGYKVRYVLYDILEYQGEDLRGKTLKERKGFLKAAFNKANNPTWELVRQLENDRRSFREIVKAGGEGVILKEISGTYIEGVRPNFWLKVKKIDTHEAIITGMNSGTGKYADTLGALVISQYVNGKLQEVATLSGMTDEQRNDFWSNKKKYIGRIIEFKAQEKTKDFRYRHPVFIRMREDKNSKECIF